MRKELPAILEVGRVRHGAYRTKRGIPGAYEVKHKGAQLLIIASNGMGWEHVSVSLKDRPPTWDEMCWVKDLFWEEDECVVQYHPPRVEYVNLHPHCLHLWKPYRTTIPTPPMELVG
jgi:hypothetical protein